MVLTSLALQAQNTNTQSAQKQTRRQNQTQTQTTTAQDQKPFGTQEQSQLGSEVQQNSRPGTADTPGAAQAAAETNENDNGGADETTVSNAPPVAQSTSSQSGSPAVLSGQKGKERDGTNSVQRASMNMAGSPAANLNLGPEQTVDVDSELKDRQDYTQEKQISAENQNQNNSGAGGADQINNNSRRENNALSDQNLSAKDKTNSKDQSTQGGENSGKEKTKRKKDKS